jgi:hypothetical protein
VGQLRRPGEWVGGLRDSVGRHGGEWEFEHMEGKLGGREGALSGRERGLLDRER